MNQKGIKNLCIIFMSLICMVIISGCSSSQKAAGNEQEAAMNKTITYGGSSWIAHLPAYIAVEKGFFEEEGIKVEFRDFPTASERLTALASGEVDFASVSAISTISLMSAGDKSFSVFGTPNSHLGQEGIVGRNMSSIEDLKGKKVAVTYSSSSHIMLLNILKEYGLVPNKDVQIINMAGGDIVSSFTTGEIDAVATWSPHFEKIQKVEGATILAKDTDTSIYKDYGFGAGPDILVIRNKFASDNPETTQKLVNGYFKAIDWVKDNPREAAELFVTLTNIDVQEQEEIINDVEWLGLAQQKEMLSEGEDLRAALNYLAEFMVEYELLNNLANVEEWINIDILPE